MRFWRGHRGQQWSNAKFYAYCRRIVARMDRINARYPDALIEELEQLVEEGRFESKSAAIRYAVRQMLQKQNNHD